MDNSINIFIDDRPSYTFIAINSIDKYILGVNKIQESQQNVKISIYMIKKARDYRSSNKKKKVSYSALLKQQLTPKSPKDKQVQVTWVNSHGNQCKRIIQPNRCFCTHSFQYHQNPKTIGSAFCRSPGCQCKCYEYVPYYDIKCMCRHSYKEHDRNSKMCKMCNKCLGFLSNWSCKCGIKYQLHQTVFEIKQLTKIKSQRIKETPMLKNKKNTLDVGNYSYNDAEIINQSDKQNQYEFNLNKSMDARTYQLTKFDVQLNVYNKNQHKMEQHKKKLIDRINQKYGNIDFEKQVKNSQDIELVKIYKPDNARTVSPLQLYIRPHNYHPIKLAKFLDQEFRKVKQK